jgi:hypothetical protein
MSGVRRVGTRRFGAIPGTSLAFTATAFRPEMCRDAPGCIALRRATRVAANGQETMMTLATDRARKHTAAAVLRRIDADTESKLLQCAESPAAVAERLAELDREWDLDRSIETEASLLGLVGLVLGASAKPQLLAIPLAVGGAVFLYALTGRYPLLPLFRRLGVRTAREIARERYALKALRGDFAAMDAESASGRSAARASSPGESPEPRPLELTGSQPRG